MKAQSNSEDPNIGELQVCAAFLLLANFRQIPT